MRLLDQFQRLADWLPKQRKPPDMAAISHALCCSERNARIVLQRMHAAGWLTWEPGRGRGIRSRITLLQDHETIRLQHLHRLLEQGKLEAAFEGLPNAGRERLRQALPGYLGAGHAGTLRIPFYRPLHALDPIHINRRTEWHIIMQLCAGLTEYDAVRECIVPALAHHWEHADDGRTWRFLLRPGLRFQDGRTLRGEDVVATLERVRDTEGPHRPLFANLRSIACEGREIVLQLDAPDHLLLNRLAHHAAVIVPEGDWLRPGFATLPVGAGAFQLVRNNEHRATLAAFDGYFRERPLLDQIDLWVIPNGSVVPEVDVNLAHTSPERWEQTPQQWSKMRQLEQGCDFVLLNPARAEFSSAARRLAVGAWLRPAVEQLAAEETRPMADGVLPHWHHLRERSVRRPSFSRPLKLVTYQLDSHIALMHCVAERLRQAGAEVETRVLSYPEFGPYGWCAWADITVAGDVLDNDMEFGLYSWLAGESIFNQWMDAQTRSNLNRDAANIAAEPDAAKRAVLVEASFAHMVQQGWVLPMRHTRHGVDYAPRLGGVQLGRCGWMDFRKLWLR